MVSPDVVKSAIAKLKAKSKKLEAVPIALSVIDDKSLEAVKKILNELAKEKHV